MGAKKEPYWEPDEEHINKEWRGGDWSSMKKEMGQDVELIDASGDESVKGEPGESECGDESVPCGGWGGIKMEGGLGSSAREESLEAEGWRVAGGW